MAVNVNFCGFFAPSLAKPQAQAAIWLFRQRLHVRFCSLVLTSVVEKETPSALFATSVLHPERKVRLSFLKCWCGVSYLRFLVLQTLRALRNLRESGIASAASLR